MLYYTRKRMRMTPKFPGQEQTQMPRRIASIGTKRKMIGLYQKTSIMKSSITGEELYIMVDSFHIPSMRR